MATTGYIRYQKLQKYYLGQPVDPPQYQKGELVSSDVFLDLDECENIYKWILVPNEYICTLSSDGTTYDRYEKLQAYDKVTNTPIDPPLYRTGDFIEKNTASFIEECENIVIWTIVDDEIICVKNDNDNYYTRYQKLQAYNKYTNEAITPFQYKEGDILAVGCTEAECNGAPREETRFNQQLSIDGALIDENITYESYDCGGNWEEKNREYVFNDLDITVENSTQFDTIIDFEDRMYTYASFVGSDGELYMIKMCDTTSSTKTPETDKKKIFKINFATKSYELVSEINGHYLSWNPERDLNADYFRSEPCPYDGYFYHSYTWFTRFGFYYDADNHILKYINYIGYLDGKRWIRMEEINILTNEKKTYDNVSIPSIYSETRYFNDGTYFYVPYYDDHVHEEKFLIVNMNGEYVDDISAFYNVYKPSTAAQFIYDFKNQQIYLWQQDIIYAGLGNYDNSFNQKYLKTTLFDFGDKEVELNNVFDPIENQPIAIATNRIEPFRYTFCDKNDTRVLDTFYRIYIKDKPYIFIRKTKETEGEYYRFLGNKDNVVAYANTDTIGFKTITTD